MPIYHIVCKALIDGEEVYLDYLSVTDLDNTIPFRFNDIDKANTVADALNAVINPSITYYKYIVVDEMELDKLF